MKHNIVGRIDLDELVIQSILITMQKKQNAKPCANFCVHIKFRFGVSKYYNALNRFKMQKAKPIF